MSACVVLFKDVGETLGFHEGWRMGKLWADMKRGDRDIGGIFSIDEAKLFGQMAARLRVKFESEAITNYNGETKVKIKVLPSVT
tara:strand:+ start:322 stop:573 length:252 start_codon:yes stop_codon:yes gene_type:complete